METRTTTTLFPLALALCTTLLGAQETRNWNIPVYILNDNRDPLALSRGETIATHILATAGVQLDWRSGRASAKHQTAQACPVLNNRPVVIQIDFTPPRNLAEHSRNALAYTFPYAESGPRINILYDRIQSSSRGSAALAGALLGHVMAHEISHVLQRIDRHSKSGVMKANWTAEDFALIGGSRWLTFDTEDLVLIRMGLESWMNTRCLVGSVSNGQYAE